ncbi:beta-N-acetylhexosaminidase [Amycolatopsis balhimycina DSM 5908]|uniref:beta-N-acetylhexosaminidase n=1 Tax=Amycolatopsis balhimycina DSM 5908 TaxID=1081091 RepID=A0A428WG86_AMYBA|nr:beta-N-acetylhexosaminidase [Amycolatopsis balhimycina]RSM42062.1 beta-N-acetylhexosaminidase [Amycolatopsis balhimycina DSM 5908]
MRLSRVVLTTAVVSLAAVAVPASAGAAPAAPERSVTDVVPAPVSAKADPRGGFRLTPATVISADRGAGQVADYLRGLLRPATGYPLPVVPHAAGLPAISLRLGHDTRVGTEGYELKVARDGVTLKATTADGLFEGVQSLRQLLPSAIEAKRVQHRTWTVAGGTILDYPRFAERGAMLDVARHFFRPDQVKLYIDQIAQYKVNTLHLHLADDQGWRIEIKSWPKLATVGGKTAVDGDPGGYYTQAQYKDIVAYAASRHITVIPEIDMPGHTNAAQSTYAELNCDGKAVPVRTDTEVGYSSLCISSPITYRFVEDVVRELAAITPGPYLHIGGDEAHATPPADYLTFERKVQPIVAKYGKKITGWHEIAKTAPPASAVPQYWDFGGAAPDVAAAAARGNKILMSPANYAYLDMKYNASTPLGQDWAALVEVKDAYNWDPATLVDGVGENQVAGVEAPLWTETIRTSDDIEYMAFPRLPGIAEIGWSPKASHNWDAYRARLAKQSPRWTAQGIDFYRSPQVDWK